MRWLKHLTMAHSDSAIDAVCDKFGAEAYGVWWFILEDIAAPMEAGKMIPIQSHSVVKWAQICRCSARRLRSIVEILSDRGLIVTETIGNRLQIEVPNILKYKDEYSKKSGQTPDLIENRYRTDREQIQNQTEPLQIPARVVVAALRKPIPEPAEQFIVSLEELEVAWERHLKHSKEEPHDLTFQVIFGMNGQFDPAKFRARHGPYCEAWSGRWQFCPLTFLAWVRAGMPQADVPKTDRQRQEDDIWREK